MINRYLVLVLFVGLWSPSPSAVAGQERGGGSFEAAEISRATDRFIEIVESYPELFPGVDVKVLRSFDPEIQITTSPLKVCVPVGESEQRGVQLELDAYSDARKNFSRFSTAGWKDRVWIDKVQLAGHERLVLAGYEPSNRYFLSNQIYQAELREQLRDKSAGEGLCQHLIARCDQVKDIEELIHSVENTGSIESAMVLLNMVETNIEIFYNLQVGLYTIQLDKKWIHFRSPQKKVERYSRKVYSAIQNHFQPILDEARVRILNSSEKPVNPCVPM